MITKDTTLQELANKLLTSDKSIKEYKEFLNKLQQECYEQGFKDCQEKYE